MKPALPYFRYFLMVVWLLAFFTESIAIIKNNLDQTHFTLLQHDQEDGDNLPGDEGEKEFKVDINCHSEEVVHFIQSSVREESVFHLHQVNICLHRHKKMIEFPPEFC